MKLSLLVVNAIVSGSIAARGAVDLSPTPSEYTAEGIKFRQLNFKDGNQAVVFEPPRGWGERGGAAELQLTPTGSVDGSAAIQVAALPLPGPTLDSAAQQGIEQEVLLGLPPQSQNAAIVSREQSPVTLDGKPTFAVTAAYEILGRPFLRSVLVAYLPGQKLTFRLTAPKSEFEKLNRAWRGSILSWHWREVNASRS